MTKTTVYLDVDGVINALSNKPPRENTQWKGAWSTAIVSPGGGRSFNIRYSHELLGALEALALLPDVEIRWLTTWTDHAPRELSEGIEWEIGKSFAVLPRVPVWGERTWWKLYSIKNDWDGTSQIVWLDDDLAYDEDAKNWLMELPVKTLGIMPNSNHGLTRGQLEQIYEFVGALPEWQTALAAN